MCESAKITSSLIDANDILEVISQHNFSNQKQIELLDIIGYILFKKQYPEKILGIIKRKIKLLKQPSDESEKDKSEEISLNDLLDNQDVMQALHISARTLQTLRSNRTLPFFQIGNKFYYRKKDISKILSDNYIMYKYRNDDKK